MNIPLTAAESDSKELAAKRRLIDIKHVAISEIPYRVTKKSNGGSLGYCKTQAEVDELIQKIPLSTLQSKPTRRNNR